MPTSGEHRQDEVMRDLVASCQQVLEPYGFLVDGRGQFDHCHWVSFQAPRQGTPNHNAAYVVLVAHDRRQHALLVDVGSRDALLTVHTPLRKWMRRYEPTAPPATAVQELMEHLDGFLSIAA